MATGAPVTLWSPPRACVGVQGVRVCFPWASIGQSEAAHVHRRRLGTGHAAGSLTSRRDAYDRRFGEDRQPQFGVVAVDFFDVELGEKVEDFLGNDLTGHQHRESRWI